VRVSCEDGVCAVGMRYDHERVQRVCASERVRLVDEETLDGAGGEDGRAHTRELLQCWGGLNGNETYLRTVATEQLGISWLVARPDNQQSIHRTQHATRPTTTPPTHLGNLRCPLENSSQRLGDHGHPIG